MVFYTQPPNIDAMMSIIDKKMRNIDKKACAFDKKMCAFDEKMRGLKAMTRSSFIVFGVILKRFRF